MVNRAQQYADRKSQWVLAVKARRGHNKALVALAAKHARIIWAMLVNGTGYQARSQVGVSA